MPTHRYKQPVTADSSATANQLGGRYQAGNILVLLRLPKPMLKRFFLSQSINGT